MAFWKKLDKLLIIRPHRIQTMRLLHLMIPSVCQSVWLHVALLCKHGWTYRGPARSGTLSWTGVPIFPQLRYSLRQITSVTCLKHTVIERLLRTANNAVLLRLEALIYLWPRVMRLKWCCCWLWQCHLADDTECTTATCRACQPSSDQSQSVTHTSQLHSSIN